MKIVAITNGTEGDTRPIAALCRGLLDAGHSTQLLADAATLNVPRALGVPCIALAGSIKDSLSPGGSLTSAAGAAKELARIANANTEAWMLQLLAAAQDCDVLIVSALASFVGLSVAEHLGITAIGASFIPISPTREFPSAFLKPGTVPRFANRWSHQLINGLVWHAFRKATNAARAKICGQAPRRKLWEGHAVLYGISRALLPQPADWPNNAFVCGQWIPPSTAWQAPQALQDFLHAGEPPVYLGFGSMASLCTPQLLAAVIKALGKRRTLFYPGWSGVTTRDLPENFFVVGDTPHDWLLPKTSFVIHHGGAGTTHSAARAGVPSVVVPFVADQFFWADRLKRAGVAPNAVTGKHPHVASIERAIELAESDALRERAASLGSEMRAEHGVPRAIAILEHLAHGGTA